MEDFVRSFFGCSDKCCSIRHRETIVIARRVEIPGSGSEGTPSRGPRSSSMSAEKRRGFEFKNNFSPTEIASPTRRGGGKIKSQPPDFRETATDKAKSRHAERKALPTRAEIRGDLCDRAVLDSYAQIPPTKHTRAFKAHSFSTARDGRTSAMKIDQEIEPSRLVDGGGNLRIRFEEYKQMDSARLREGTERTNEEKNGENTRATVGIALQTVAAGKVFIAAVRRGGPAAHAVPPLLVRLCTDVFAAVMSVFLLLFAGVQAFRTWLSARDLTRSALTKVGDMLLSVGDTMCDESVSSQTILQLLEGPAGSSIAISVCGESDVKDVVLQRVPEHELGRGWLYPMPEKFGVL